MEAGDFDDMYARSDDPWGFTSRWYERRKYAISLAMLPQERYRQRVRARLLDRRSHGATSPALRAAAGL